MKITDEIRVLVIQDNRIILHPTLIIDGEDLILVDTGFPSSFPMLEKAIENEGFTINQITKIILTHQDWDHIGCVNTILKVAPKAKVYTHVLERPYIEGEEIPIKVAKLKEEQKYSEYEHDKSIFEKCYCKIDDVFYGDEEIGNTISIQVINTPGHTIGHISLYLPQSKIIISGDALYNIKGKLTGSKDEYTQDKLVAKESVKKFVSLSIDTIVCYHGGVYRNNIKQSLENIIR